MNKCYCFYCQQDVQPKGFWKLRFCPHCKHLLTDKGRGFYRVCEYCGSNMPVDALYCCQCKMCISGRPKLPWIIEVMQNRYVNTIVQISAVALLILLAVAVLYVSFYALLGLFVFGAVCYLFSLISRK